MSSKAAITGLDRPSIFQGLYRAFILADHRFNRDAHARHQALPTARVPIIGNFGVFVQLLANAVANIFTHNGETVLLHVALHCVADIPHSCTCLRGSNAKVQTLFGHIQQALGFQVELAAGKGTGVITVKTINLAAGVNRNDIAGADLLVAGGDTVDDGVIHADTCRGGKTVQMTSIHELLKKEAEAVLNIPVSDAYEKAVALIVEQVHNKRGKLVTTGMGKAGQIAMNIATTFCSTGIPAVFLHPSEAQHGDLGILQENDLLLLISNSGKTREIVELTQLAHTLNPTLKYIVITGNADSPLARESDICLCTGHPDEVCALGMTPTTSTTVMTVIGDILVVETMKRTGFTIEEYSKRHHGGYLGERSRELSK